MQIRRSEITLFVSDIPRSVEFYTRALGFVRHADPAHGEPDGTWDKVATGDFVLAFFKAKSAEPALAPGSRPMMSADMVVDDFDAAVRGLEAVGSRMGKVRDWPEGRVVVFYDPDGIAWELISIEKGKSA